MTYETLASEQSVQRTIDNLKSNGVEAFVVKTAADALANIKELIPTGASVMNGSSRTLEQIGFIEYLKSGTHPWKNLHEDIVKETDKAKQGVLRKQAVLSDYYLGSVHAMSETGEFVIASNSGSQLPHIVYTSSNLIFVVSTKKITASLPDAMRRLEEHVVPLEDARMKSTGAPGTYPSKILIFRKEQSWGGRTVRVMFVQENLGF